ncbi:Lrp/AsnC family transcriptional regulator [Nonomuraea angiospora]|uniref:Lrp/AsnC family transcriptional regulator n=1 Tax=Nonomuraea angiospora TaxID=46172 RepID=UPI0037BA0094
MERSVTLDPLDLQLLQALQLDGRAAFRRIAEVLEVSENTIARRYRRLSADGLRIVARTVPERLGEATWLLRIQSTPDATAKLAEAIARLPESSYVSIDSADTQIHCGITTTAAAENGPPTILANLKRTNRVTAISAHLLLRTYEGDPPSWYTKLDPLTPEQQAALTPEPPRPHLVEEPAALDDTDRALLARLASDARATLPELSAATDVSTATAKRRLDHLRANGILLICTEFPHRRLGYRLMTYLWLRVEPARLEAVGLTLATHQPISFAAATTGPHNLVAATITRGTNDLYQYLTTQVGHLSGIQSIETAPALHQLKRSG